MRVFPDQYLDLGEFKPWLSWLVLAALTVCLAWLFNENPYFAAELVGLVLISAMLLPAVESALGYWIAPVALAICGLVAWLLATTGMRSDLTMQLGGVCSAAIGFVIGLLRAKPVRIFYLIPGRAGDVALPALVLLVPWLFVELGIRAVDSSWPLVLRFQQLAAGFVIGVLFSGLGFVKGRAMGARLRQIPLDEGIQQAQELIASHDLRRARRLLADLTQLYPAESELIELRYSAWKFDPKNQEFHDAAAALLNRSGVNAETHTYVERFYKDYLAVTQGQPKLPMGLHLRLGQRFARAGDLKLAANIMNPYLQRDMKHEELPQALVTLTECYVDANRPRQALRYAELVSAQFPGTQESQQARRIMRQLKALAG